MVCLIRWGIVMFYFFVDIYGVIWLKDRLGMLCWVLIWVFFVFMGDGMVCFC